MSLSGVGADADVDAGVGVGVGVVVGVVTVGVSRLMAFHLPCVGIAWETLIRTSPDTLPLSLVSIAY